MQTELVSADSPRCIPAALEALRAGLPVALPSETVYGLAADALKPRALTTIFEAKERPFFDPLILHLPDSGWLEKITCIPVEDRALVERLAAAFWPGPLTLVLPRCDSVPDLACAGLPTVAVRIPAHPVFQSVLQAFGGPLAAPSANRFGRISPTTASHVAGELDGKIPLIIDGGATQHGIESTILRLQRGTLEILRPGPVSMEDLEYFAPVRIAPATDSTAPSAPGRMESHYAPLTPMHLLPSGTKPVPIAGKRCGLLAWTSDGSGFDVVENLGGTGELHAAAMLLFAAMRRLDAAGLQLIIAEPVPDRGLGRAINDRLARASSITHHP